jgi:lipopolysaccharide/colanic/teichoic acid biosynthesis glycosyltransferase
MKLYRPLKRLLDIILSFIAMVLFLPFFIPIAIALKLTGEGYIFYFQDRIGHKNKKFKIWKFATMLKASPSLGTGSITVKNDWRLTPLGGFLRKTKINEIPQIMNVFLGSMSIVGPRPQMEVDFLKYPESMRDKINNVKPGITGMAAIFFRDEVSRPLRPSHRPQDHLCHRLGHFLSHKPAPRQALQKPPPSPPRTHTHTNLTTR